MAENTTKVEGTSESQHSNNAVLGAVVGIQKSFSKRVQKKLLKYLFSNF